MQKHIEQIDRKTGEVMQGCMVYLPYRPKLREMVYGIPRHVYRDRQRPRLNT